MNDYLFRQFAPIDSVEELTTLLHRAYADHAAAGRRYFATHQTPDDTRRRIAKGECWLAVRRGAGDGGSIVGTVTLEAGYEGPPDYPVAAGCGKFFQLAVLPELRGTGLGSRLLALTEQRIAALGGKAVVLDTSSLALDLIAWYERRGYVKAGVWRWEVTNYESVVLRKLLI